MGLCVGAEVWNFFFFFKSGSSTPLSRMVVSGLDLKQNARSGLVPVITLGLWVGLGKVSLW